MKCGPASAANLSGEKKMCAEVELAFSGQPQLARGIDLYLLTTRIPERLRRDGSSPGWTL
jgi:hypothetical protein